MATTATTRAGAAKPVKDSMNDGLVSVMCSQAITVNPTAADILQLVPIPRNARIVDVTVTFTDMDSNGTPTITFTVGDTQTTSTANRYITTSTVGQTGGVARLNNQVGHMFQFLTDGTIDLTWGVASATFASGTLTCTVIYSTDLAA